MVGNPSKFDGYDVLRCLLRVHHNAARASLSKELNLGEGTLRSILNILKEKKLAVSTTQGHSLTKKGEKIKKSVGEVLQFKPCSINLFTNKKKTAFLVKVGKKIRVGYVQRDSALKHGAEAALILAYDKGLRMMEGSYFDTTPLERVFDFKKNDVLLITVAESFYLSERSGLAVCAELLPNLGRVINSFRTQSARKIRNARKKPGK